MEITYTTEISELLPLNAIVTKITDMQTEVKSHTSTRIDLLTSNQAHGLSSSILVSGEPLFNTKANEIIKEYEVVEEWIDNFIVSAGIKAAADKRLEELGLLWDAVDAEKTRLEEENAGLESTFQSEAQKIKNLNFTDVLTNIILPITVPTGVTSWAITATSKLFSISKLDNVYHGEDSTIAKNKKSIAAYEEKLNEIEEQMKKGNEIYGGDYSSVTAATTSNTDDDGTLGLGGGLGWDTDDPETADPTDATEKDDSSDKGAADNNTTTTFTGTDKVIIGGEEYTIRGYVTTSDGKNRVIYGKGMDSYYIDNDGNVQNATKQVGYGVQHYVVDGEEFNNYTATSGSMKPTETFEVSEIDSQYASVKEKEVSASQTITGATVGSTVPIDGTEYECCDVVKNGNDYRKIFKADNKYYYVKDGGLVEVDSTDGTNYSFDGKTWDTTMDDTTY